MISQFSHINKAIHFLDALAKIKHPRPYNSHKLDNIRQILDALGNPQDSFKSIHIAGTKGKSSTSYACSYFLKEHGHLCGLFTSPHIHSYQERIRIDHQPIFDEQFLRSLNCVIGVMHKHNLDLSVFEILTAVACDTFRHNAIEYAIFEVGIGGMYDTTNFLFPEICIITDIEVEHVEILGKDIKHIAYNKAGIIKPSTPVFIGTQTSPEALEVLQNYAQTQRAPVFYIPEHITIVHQQDLKQSSFSKSAHIEKIRDIENVSYSSDDSSTGKNPTLINSIRVETQGLSQIILENQVLADITTHYVLQKTLPSSRTYSKEAQLLCRSELLSDNSIPLFLDGAHTPHSIHHALNCLQRLSFEHIILILALVKGKNYKGINKQIATNSQNIKEIIISKAGYFKESECEDVLQLMKGQLMETQLTEAHPLKNPTPNTTLIEHNDTAMEYAYRLALDTPSSVIAVLGSFFICANCRQWYLSQKI